MGHQGRYNICRVGALAVALGIGGVIAALPAVADADTGAGDSGKTTALAGKHAPRNSTKPGPRASKPPTPNPAAAAKPSGALSAASRVPLDRLGTGDDPLAPVTEPLSWAVLAVTRREGTAGSARLAGTIRGTTALITSTSDPTDTPLAASATASTGLDSAIRGFIDHYLPGWKPIADELAPIVADGIQDLLSNGAVGAEVNRLVTNDAIRQFVSTKIATALGAYLGVPPSVGTVVGDAATNFVRNVLATAGV
jgi:hypothetical protein